MNTTKNKSEIINFEPKGVCCKLMQVEVENSKLKNVQFHGGCPGNLEAMGNLLKGMSLDEIINKFNGIRCGEKSTSCADQLATCLKEYLK